MFRKKKDDVKENSYVDMKIEYDKTVLQNIKDFLIAHPEIIYKGVPLAVAVYILYPVIVMGISFLPYLWAMYYTYSIIPSWVFTAATLYFKKDRLIEGATKMLIKSK